MHGLLGLCRDLPSRRHSRGGALVTSDVARPTGSTHPVGPTHPIEVESFQILEGRLDLGRWPVGPRAVVARVVHATADIDLGMSMVVDQRAVEVGSAALAAGAPVLCDVMMVKAGLPSVDARCYLGEIGSPPSPFPTRSALAMQLAAARHPHDAIVAVGCAPTALDEVITLVEGDAFQPALVVAVPVGFVGAAQAKERLRQYAARTGLPVISNIGEKGGSAAACAAVNALRTIGRSRGET
jgi:precorrin-8X/cobalt-precorrin-8 methylmutase